MSTPGWERDGCCPHHAAILLAVDNCAVTAADNRGKVFSLCCGERYQILFPARDAIVKSEAESTMSVSKHHLRQLMVMVPGAAFELAVSQAEPGRSEIGSILMPGHRSSDAIERSPGDFRALHRRLALSAAVVQCLY